VKKKVDAEVRRLSIYNGVDDYILNNYYSVAEYEKFSILAPHPSKK
jgi:hypothetical protein